MIIMKLIEIYYLQMFDQPLNGTSRSLCGASWALAPPNSLRYQNLKSPPLSHPFHHASRPQTALALDQDWDGMVSLCVLQPKESEEQHTLIEVSNFGQIKLSELLALGPNRPFELFPPLTTVDGSREDDISITAIDRKEGATLGMEDSGSFRSLFEMEGCPAPFVLGSRFYCFHCPGFEPLVSSADLVDRLNLRHELEAQALGLPPLPSLLHFQDEPNRALGSKSNSERENEEKLAVMYERLRLEVSV